MSSPGLPPPHGVPCSGCALGPLRAGSRRRCSWHRHRFSLGRSGLGGRRGERHPNGLPRPQREGPRDPRGDPPGAGGPSPSRLRPHLMHAPHPPRRERHRFTGRPDHCKPAVLSRRSHHPVRGRGEVRAGPLRPGRAVPRHADELFLRRGDRKLPGSAGAPPRLFRRAGARPEGPGERLSSAKDLHAVRRLCAHRPRSRPAGGIQPGRNLRRAVQRACAEHR